MRTFRILSLALITSLAASPAFAQDTSTDTGKRFAVVGGYTHLDPKTDAAPGLKVDGDGAPTLSASWYATDNFAVELWGAADKFNHRVRGDGVGKIGTVEQQPIALSGQWHFGQADNVFRPFVGLGYHQTNISGEDVNAGGDHVGLTSPKGAIGTVGVDINITPTWFARADARYLDGKADAKLAGETFERDIRFRPWTVGFGVGARF